MKKIIIIGIVVAMMYCIGCDSRENVICLDEVSDIQDAELYEKADNTAFYSDECFDIKTSDTENVSMENFEVSESDVAKIVVYVCGAVKATGVYELLQGDRIVDAITAAGGFCEDADTDYLNQALLLNDGEKIYVPTISETEEVGLATAGVLLPAGGNENLMANTNGAGDLIDINYATKEELMTLPGVGEAKASAIVEYREQNGLYTNIEDVMLVPGIKNGLFEKIKEKIKV